MRTKYWYARVVDADWRDYGRWVPTGMIDRSAAEDYIDAVYGRNRTNEWLLL